MLLSDKHLLMGLLVSVNFIGISVIELEMLLPDLDNNHG